MRPRVQSSASPYTFWPLSKSMLTDLSNPDVRSCYLSGGFHFNFVAHYSTQNLLERWAILHLESKLFLVNPIVKSRLSSVQQKQVWVELTHTVHTSQWSESSSDKLGQLDNRLTFGNTWYPLYFARKLMCYSNCGFHPIYQQHYHSLD